jgi:hypothetical protein
MKSLSRLALAALLTGAVAAPGFAQEAPVVPAPVPHAATGTTAGTVKPDAGKQAVGKPAAITDKAGSHAPTTQLPPAAIPPKTN